MTATDRNNVRRTRLAEAATAAGLDVDIVDEMQFRDRYRVLSGNLNVSMDVFFDGQARVTGVEPGSATTATDLVLRFIEAVETIDAGYLRPRFRDRVASPAALIDLHRRQLQDQGLELCGLRLAQFQIMYDIEDPRDLGSAAPLAMALWYNRRGVVTSVICDDSAIGYRAVKAVGVAHCVEYRTSMDDGESGE